MITSEVISADVAKLAKENGMTKWLKWVLVVVLSLAPGRSDVGASVVILLSITDHQQDCRGEPGVMVGSESTGSTEVGAK